MLTELIILGGLALIFIGVVLLAIINWLEAREERKLSERLSRYYRPGDSFDDVRFKDYEK
jgi:protein-S-isoprenylcysteine O-methyltransferase Ste14